MPGPAEDRQPNGNSPKAAVGAAEMAELRRLVVGPDLDRLDGVQKRIEDPEQRAVDVAQILPNAIAAAKPKTLREALEPVFEKSFQNSVRKHPKELADAIFPIIGPAIRRSIGVAIREFAETLNQIVEKSASFRALRWRIEAVVTGKPFSEILLARSLLYSVEQVFLIHRKSGLLLLHAANNASVLKDADMISGMLTAIQDFFSDSFTDGGQDLETVDSGRFKLWIQHGSKALLVAAVSGTAPIELRGVLRNNLDKIHEILYAPLDTFKQDDLSVFEPGRPCLESCLLGQSGPGKRRGRGAGWVVLLIVVAALGTWTYFLWRAQSRWDRFVADLKGQPGIVVTGIETRGGKHVVSGLKDPLAADPAASLHKFGVKESDAAFELRPYLSLDTPYAAARELKAARERVESAVVRFDVGSAKTPIDAIERIEEVAAAISRVLRENPGARLAVTGHTDEVGGEETNLKLSRDRANEIAAALLARGIPANRMEVRAVGNREPLRPGESAWDRASNRSVSLRFIAAQ